MIFHRRILLQVTLPALGISLILGIVCVLGIRSLNRLQVDRSRLLIKDVASLEAALEVEVRLRQVRFHSLEFVMEPTPQRNEVLKEDHRQYEAAINKARAASDLPEEFALIARVEKGYQTYREALFDESQRPPATAPIAEHLAWADTHSVRHLLVPCDELMSLNRRSIMATAEANESLTSQTTFMMIFLGTLGPIAGLIGGIGIAWGWSRSFSRLRLRIQDAHAELDREIGSIQVAAEGDWHQLDRQMEVVLERVRSVVTQLQQQQRELLRAEQMAAVGHLAAGVAHEVRNPLTGIKLLIEAALRSTASELLNRDELRMMLDDIHRVERTVQGLLDFARPVHSVRRSIDVRELLRQAIDSLRGRSEQRNVSIPFVTPDRPIPVSVDLDQFLSMMTNVIINAIEASSSGGEVRIELHDSLSGPIMISVRDQGAGISEAMRLRLFTPFATDKPNGTGLGLCVAQRIAREHGGELTASSHPDGGANFTITLPEKGNELV